MTNLFLLYCCTLLFIFNKINCLFLIIDPREHRCISRDMSSDEYFGGFYVISGEDETGVNVYISNDQNKKLWSVSKQKSGSFQMGISIAGQYNLCIENTSDKQIIFSFEFSEDKKEEQVLSIGIIVTFKLKIIF